MTSKYTAFFNKYKFNFSLFIQKLYILYNWNEMERLAFYFFHLWQRNDFKSFWFQLIIGVKHYLTSLMLVINDLLFALFFFHKHYVISASIYYWLILKHYDRSFLVVYTFCFFLVILFFPMEQFFSVFYEVFIFLNQILVKDPVLSEGAFCMLFVDFRQLICVLFHREFYYYYFDYHFDKLSEEDQTDFLQVHMEWDLIELSFFDNVILALNTIFESIFTFLGTPAFYMSCFLVFLYVFYLVYVYLKEYFVYFIFKQQYPFTYNEEKDCWEYKRTIFLYTMVAYDKRWYITPFSRCNIFWLIFGPGPGSILWFFLHLSLFLFFIVLVSWIFVYFYYKFYYTYRLFYSLNLVFNEEFQRTFFIFQPDFFDWNRKYWKFIWFGSLFFCLKVSIILFFVGLFVFLFISPLILYLMEIFLYPLYLKYLKNNEILLYDSLLAVIINFIFEQFEMHRQVVLKKKQYETDRIPNTKFFCSIRHLLGLIAKSFLGFVVLVSIIHFIHFTFVPCSFHIDHIFILLKWAFIFFFIISIRLHTNDSYVVDEEEAESFVEDELSNKNNFFRLVELEEVADLEDFDPETITEGYVL